MTELSIAKTKKKTAYNVLSQDMLEQKNFGIEQYVENLIELTKAKKGVLVKGATGEASIISEQPENTVRFNAVSEIGDIFGAKAPKQVDLKHSMAAMSDEEIRNEIDNSVKDIGENGRIQRRITGTQSKGTVITNTIACKESAMAVGAIEQATCPADS